MNQQEYEHTISEMVIPDSKIITWIEAIEQKQYDQYNTTNRDLFDRELNETNHVASGAN